MKQITEIDEIRLIVPFAGWMDRHPRLTNAIIIAGLLAFAWIVLSYEFTIPMYR